MATVTESDIKELKDLIVAFQQDVSTRLTAIETRLTVIETRLDTWKPAMDKIPDLAEKVGEVKNWKQAGLIILTAMVSSIFSGIIGGVIGWLIRDPRV